MKLGRHGYLSSLMEREQTIIQPPSKLSVNFRELWKYRELFYFFTWRDVKVKYKQTSLGILWTLLQPLALMIVFTFVFKQLKVHTVSMRYEIFVLSGIILWNFFNSSISNASDSIIVQSNIIKKIYFPRLVVPCSSLLTALFDFTFAFFLFIGFCIVFKNLPGINALLFFPIAILQLLLSAFGISVFFSALNVKYRDFRYIIPFLLQLLFFASPIIYSIADLTKPWLKYILAANPMNGIIELFRFPFTNTIDMEVVIISAISTIFSIFMGLYYFRKTEAYFADLA